MKKRVADIIVETLVSCGITDCFAVVGGGAMHLDNALGKNEQMNIVFNHHEQACAIAAEGYAKLEGKIPVVCVTSGPGTTNTLTGVMGAWVDSVPMVVISGQMRYALMVEPTGLPLRFRANQEFNIVDTVKTMTKYAKLLKNPAEVKKEVEKAVYIATSGRRGPVWLDVPLDIQNAMVEEDELEGYTPEQQLPVPTKEALEQIRTRIQQAKRPLILVGNGVGNSGNFAKFRSFMEGIEVPVVSAALAADALYRDHPYYFGISGFIGPRTGNFVLQNADYILAIGTSMGFKTTGYEQDSFAVGAYVTMVDIEPAEAKKPGVRIDQFVHADVAAFLDSAAGYIKGLKAPQAWIDYCNMVKTRFTPFEATEERKPEERVCSYCFWKAFEKYEPEDSIVVLGNNTGISSKLQIGVKQKHQRVIANNNCGSMGYDLPAAVGAAVYAKKPVICATGDGSIMMNLQELQTIHHYDLPVKVVVFSNDGYNAIRQTCKNFFGGYNVGCSKDSGVSFPSFEKVADTFGFAYYHCRTNGELDEAIAWLFAQDKQAILELDQRLDDPITPRIFSRLAEDGTFLTPALEDMCPFLEQDELNELMISKKGEAGC